MAYGSGYLIHIDNLQALILNKSEDEGLNILFYVFPGVGKSEFARVLAKNLKLKLFEINNIEETRENRNSTFFRFLAFLPQEAKPVQQAVQIDHMP